MNLVFPNVKSAILIHGIDMIIILFLLKGSLKIKLTHNGVNTMICKRCEQRIPDNTRNRAPYCRHCYQAIQQKKALDKINNLWDKVTN